MRLSVIAAALALCLNVAEPAAGEGPVTRDERAVKVDGVEETWRLEWLDAPVPVCQPRDEDWWACPCRGFAFGEEGELDLVRLRESREVDRLHLTPLFAIDRDDAGEPPPDVSGRHHAALRHWPVRDIDEEAFERANANGRRDFRKRVMERKPVRILALADFNHDGWATEFVLQIGALPCGKRQSVLIGVSPGQPKLHAFGSADHPERPLILEAATWQKLRDAKGPGRLVEWPCGDHGAEEQREIALRIDAEGIHAARETFACGPSGTRQGDPLSREAL